MLHISQNIIHLNFILYVKYILFYFYISSLYFSIYIYRFIAMIILPNLSIESRIIGRN